MLAPLRSPAPHASGCAVHGAPTSLRFLIELLAREVRLAAPFLLDTSTSSRTHACYPPRMPAPATLAIDRSSAPAFSLAARARSFAHAIRGIRYLVASQHNAWIHATATFAAIGLAIFLRLPRVEWLALVFAIASVWIAEAINTAIEAVCDLASPGFHPLVAKAKDVAAAAVLIAAIGAVFTGVLVLGPRLLVLFA